MQNINLNENKKGMKKFQIKRIEKIQTLEYMLKKLTLKSCGFMFRPTAQHFGSVSPAVVLGQRIFQE